MPPYNVGHIGRNHCKNNPSKRNHQIPIIESKPKDGICSQTQSVFGTRGLKKIFEKQLFNCFFFEPFQEQTVCCRSPCIGFRRFLKGNKLNRTTTIKEITAVKHGQIFGPLFSSRRKMIGNSHSLPCKQRRRNDVIIQALKNKEKRTKERERTKPYLIEYSQACLKHHQLLVRKNVKIIQRLQKPGITRKRQPRVWHSSQLKIVMLEDSVRRNVGKPTFSQIQTRRVVLFRIYQLECAMNRLERSPTLFKSKKKK